MKNIIKSFTLTILILCSICLSSKAQFGGKYIEAYKNREKIALQKRVEQLEKEKQTRESIVIGIIIGAVLVVVINRLYSKKKQE